MRRTIATLVILLFTSNMFGQSQDWTTVQELPAGTQISVLYGKFPIHNRCTYKNATENKLICERELHGGPFQILIPPEAVYSRTRVRSVRLEYSTAHNVLVGAAIGAAVGGAIGATGSGDARARFAVGFVFAIGGSALGGMLGRDFPIFHRQTIYRQ